MKIVVLDGYVLNPGDLSWNRLEKLGQVEIYSQSTHEEMLERGKDADIIITNKVRISDSDMQKLANLKYIGITATGFNIVDTEAAGRRGIIVTNVPAYSTEAVAQATFALILEITNQVALHDRAVKANEWSTCPSFCFWKSPLSELNGKTLGIYGMGNIGRRVCTIAKAFGMNVVFYSRSEKHDVEAKQVSFDELLADSDYLTLHTPLFKDNQNIINAAALAKMKKNAVLINTARGGLIDSDALYHALKNGVIRAAGVDVLSEEPPMCNDKLFELDNLFITPHIAWAAKETRERLMEIAITNVESFIAGKPQNVVS